MPSVQSKRFGEFLSEINRGCDAIQRSAKARRAGRLHFYRAAVHYLWLQKEENEYLMGQVQRSGLSPYDWVAGKFALFAKSELGMDHKELFRAIENGMTEKQWMAGSSPGSFTRKQKAAAIAVRVTCITEKPPLDDRPADERIRDFEARLEVALQSIRELQRINAQLQHENDQLSTSLTRFKKLAKKV